MKVESGIFFEQVARIGKAISSPKRLELLNLLSQSEKTVDVLAVELNMDIKLASAHLKALKGAHLVTAKRDGKFMVYRLSGQDVATLWVTLHRVAEAHLLELRHALGDMTATTATVTPIDRMQLISQAEKGEVIVIDVRPSAEYEAAHLPFARSLPLDELEARLEELPFDKEVVAYCRGPFCIMANQAVATLTAKGYQIRNIREGINEWRASGMPLEYA
jgi:rhodanese-related sulfurtransferase/DNA-binding transcriptional ArsR family regulator